MSSFLGTRGPWDQAATLHQTALDAARNAGDRSGQAGALNQLGILHHLAGDYQAAADNHRRALALFGEAGDRQGRAYALINLGIVQRLTGNYPAAAASQQQALALLGEDGDQPGQANAFNQLGFVQQLSGEYPAASTSLRQALVLYGDIGHAFGQADTLNNLGTVLRLTGHYAAAAASHRQALALFRAIDHQPGQAWALNDLGVVQQLTGECPAAAASHWQALELYRDFGDQLGQAEALNNLGELSTRIATGHHARSQHRRALEIARDINAPLEEARALEGIGRCYMQEGDDGEGQAWLCKALTIYQRIGASAAERVQETLRNLKLPESGERSLCAACHRSRSLHDPCRPARPLQTITDLPVGGLPGPWLPSRALRAGGCCGPPGVGHQPGVDRVADPALEAAQRLLAGLALGDFLVVVGPAVAVLVADLADRGHVDRMVEAPVPFSATAGTPSGFPTTPPPARCRCRRRSDPGWGTATRCGRRRQWCRR
jgi:tetratricopeptide (TPR) repeat protein